MHAPFYETDDRLHEVPTSPLPRPAAYIPRPRRRANPHRGFPLSDDDHGRHLQQISFAKRPCDFWGYRLGHIPYDDARSSRERRSPFCALAELCQVVQAASHCEHEIDIRLDEATFAA